MFSPKTCLTKESLSLPNWMLFFTSKSTLTTATFEQLYCRFFWNHKFFKNSIRGAFKLNLSKNLVFCPNWGGGGLPIPNFDSIFPRVFLLQGSSRLGQILNFYRKFVLGASLIIISIKTKTYHFQLLWLSSETDNAWRWQRRRSSHGCYSEPGSMRGLHILRSNNPKQ